MIYVDPDRFFFDAELSFLRLTTFLTLSLSSKRVKHFVGRTLLMKSQRFKFEVFSLVLIRSAFPES